jgi:hypothetical protein
MKTNLRVFFAALCLASCIADACRADVARIEIVRREPFAGDMEFGTVGRYEKLVGDRLRPRLWIPLVP